METPQDAIPPPPPPPLPSASVYRQSGEAKAHDVKPETTIQGVLERQFHRITAGSEEAVVMSRMTPLRPVLQDGPQCGLVALSMASQLLQDHPVSVDALFEMAKSLQFTKKGEMFSVENMKTLAEACLQGLCAEIVCDEHRQKGQVIKHLLKGKPVLIPYDSDSNFEPCLKHGHTAHWAVLHGICLVLHRSSLNECMLENVLEMDSVCSRIFHIHNAIPEKVFLMLSHLAESPKTGPSKITVQRAMRKDSESSKTLFLEPPISIATHEEEAMSAPKRQDLNYPLLVDKCVSPTAIPHNGKNYRLGFTVCSNGLIQGNVKETAIKGAEADLSAYSGPNMSVVPERIHEFFEPPKPQEGTVLPRYGVENGYLVLEDFKTRDLPRPPPAGWESARRLGAMAGAAVFLFMAVLVVGIIVHLVISAESDSKVLEPPVAANHTNETVASANLQMDNSGGESGAQATLEGDVAFAVALNAASHRRLPHMLRRSKSTLSRSTNRQRGSKGAAAPSPEQRRLHSSAGATSRLSRRKIRQNRFAISTPNSSGGTATGISRSAEKTPSEGGDNDRDSAGDEGYDDDNGSGGDSDINVRRDSTAFSREAFVDFFVHSSVHS
ncbi:hypothetical protein HPB50_016478 [Hyalomma asiaticum]|uniref:Uncharacterized protein n=1 Tax=Hyalomma asiaticum TaxID=266040 RepID=A0ACB7RV79_HYAAI|nr:hypothetical protein HPB50_016478 [Hyalomma asiaticum]